MRRRRIATISNMFTLVILFSPAFNFVDVHTFFKIRPRPFIEYRRQLCMAVIQLASIPGQLALNRGYNSISLDPRPHFLEE